MAVVTYEHAHLEITTYPPIVPHALVKIHSVHSTNSPSAVQAELRKRQLTYKDLADRIHMSEASIKRMFSTQSLTVDRLGLIELLPQNRVRLRIARNFRWRPDGVMERHVIRPFEREFVQSGFDAPGEMKVFASAMLSRESNSQLQRQLRKLAALVAELHEADSRLPREQTFGSSLLLAFRPWEPKMFARKRRQPDQRHF